MKICVCGWYFRPRYLAAVRCSGYESIVIKHREGETCGIPSVLYPNVGLEFGAYRSYVEDHWDGQSDVFFTHDDAEVTDTSAFAMVESLNDAGVDHAYIFHDEYDEMVNGGCHGRGMWIRGSVLAKIADDFPADLENNGINIGKIAQIGIWDFHKRITKVSRDTGVIAIIPQFRFAFRGRIHEKMAIYRRTESTPKGEVLVAE